MEDSQREYKGSATGEAQLRDTTHAAIDKLEKRIAEDKKKPMPASLKSFNEALDAHNRVGMYLELGKHLKRMGARERGLLYDLVEQAAAQIMSSLTHTLNLLADEDAAAVAGSIEDMAGKLGRADDYPERLAGTGEERTYTTEEPQ